MERYKIGMQKVACMINKLNIISTNGGKLRLVIRINIVTVNYAGLLI